MSSQRIAGRASTILAVMSFIAAGSTPVLGDTVLLRPGGQLNGIPIDPTNPIVAVEPSAPLSGTILVRAHNAHGPGPIVPVGATVTWGDRAAQSWQVARNIPQGWTNLAVTVAKTAPPTPGLYHVVVANAGECQYLQVLSGTNWATPRSPSYCGVVESGPIWNDGNDLGWDWTEAQFDQALTTGQVTQQIWSPRSSTFLEATYGAAWVAVRVACGEHPEFPGLLCRLEELLATISHDETFAGIRKKLLTALNRARTQIESAISSCDKSDLRTSREHLSRGQSALTSYKLGLMGRRAHRSLDSTLRASFIGRAGGMVRDLRRLRKSLECPAA